MKNLKFQDLLIVSVSLMEMVSYGITLYEKVVPWVVI